MKKNNLKTKIGAFFNEICGPKSSLRNQLAANTKKVKQIGVPMTDLDGDPDEVLKKMTGHVDDLKRLRDTISSCKVAELDAKCVTFDTITSGYNAQDAIAKDMDAALEHIRSESRTATRSDGQEVPDNQDQQQLSRR